MTTKNEEFSIYLETYKKYLTFVLYQPSIHEYIETYREKDVVMVYGPDKSINVTRFNLQKKQIALSIWLQKDKVIPKAEKDKIIDILNEMAPISFLMPALNVTKTMNSTGVIAVSNVEAIDDMNEKIEKYNAGVERIKVFFKKYNPNPIAFYQEVYTPPESSWGFRSQPPRDMKSLNIAKLNFSENYEKNILIEHLIPKKIEMKKALKDLAAYIKENDSIIARKSIEEDKKATAEMFVVHTRAHSTHAREGFLGKDNYYGPLNEAELFYDSARAIRSAKARGVKDIQVWKVGLRFKGSSHTSENFRATTIMDSIIAIQEQELIEDMLKTEGYKKLEQENIALRKILEDNNLLPSGKSESAEKTKRNKI